VVSLYDVVVPLVHVDHPATPNLEVSCDASIVIVYILYLKLLILCVWREHIEYVVKAKCPKKYSNNNDFKVKT